MYAVDQILGDAAPVMADHAECYQRIGKTSSQLDQERPRQHHVAQGCVPDYSDIFHLLRCYAGDLSSRALRCPCTFIYPKSHDSAYPVSSLPALLRKTRVSA
jgi:hypothetical protein